MALRISFKIGGRVKINNSEVLPVTLAIYDQQEQIEELVSFLSPLEAIYKVNLKARRKELE